MSVLERHHSLEALCVVLVRNPISQQQTFLGLETTAGLQQLVQERNLKAHVSSSAAQYVCNKQARSWAIRAQPRTITDLPPRSRVELCNFLLCEAAPNRQKKGWIYGETCLSELQKTVSEWPATLPYISPKNMSTAQQAALLGLVVQRMSGQQDDVAQHARRYLADRIDSDLELALAVLDTAFGAEPIPQSTAQQGVLALQCLPGSSKLGHQYQSHVSYCYVCRGSRLVPAGHARRWQDCPGATSHS